MFSDIKEAILNFISHRLFALILVFIVLMGILVLRLFSLQIINGEDYLDEFTVMSEKTITTNGQRGNIYDCNGNLLAYNRLTYSLTYNGDDAGIEELAQKEDKTVNSVKNEILYKILKILGKNGDKIVNSFEIKRNKKGEFVFSSSNENTILQFKKEVYSASSVEKLTADQKNADAKTVFEYLKNGNQDLKKDRMFGVSEEYEDAVALKIVAIRYMLWLKRYNLYEPVKIAMDISDKSVAAIMESANELVGADIESDSVREYNYSPYFSQIVGYTGVISEEEKTELNKKAGKKEQYTGSEVIGKTGLEQEYESVLRGKNGSKTVLVDSVGHILKENDDEVETTTGNDIYLTIDAELEKECYNIMEKYLAGIILTYYKNTNIKTKSPVNITTTEMYFALFNNNIISMDHLRSKKASDAEKRISSAISNAKQNKLSTIHTELLSTHTTQKSLSDENQEYMSYIYSMLCKKNIVKSSELDTNDEMYQEWNNDTVSLGEFLEYAFQKSWIDSSSFDLTSNYYDTEEMMSALIKYIENELSDDTEFEKKVLEYLIDDGTVSGRDCCLVLYDQGILDASKDEDYVKLSSGALSAYSFMYQKVKNLEIKPSQLALDPCSGSIVVTDVKTGKVKALVSYPSYDNNKLANNLDDDYYNSLLNDKTSPFLNRATQSSTAPGSTFKMVSASAGLAEGVIKRGETINCTGIYDVIPLSPKCWIYPSRHRNVTVTDAIGVSCNYFFYEVGHRLSTKADGTIDEEYGLKRLAKYASMYGLDSKSGIELDENEPQISNQDAVRSAIGQGKNSFAPAQLSRYVTTVANSGKCYSLSILDKQTDSDGNTVKEYEPELVSEVNLSSSTWDAIHKGMYEVVHGKLHKEIFSSMHTEVAGKTGTAEEDKTRSNHALFVSYAPYEKPEISVTVVIPHGYSSSNAMEVAKDVYKYYFSEAEAKADEKDKKNKKQEQTQAVVPAYTSNTD